VQCGIINQSAARILQATQFASAMLEQGDAAGAGPSPASNGPPVVKLAKRNCQPMPATASINELAVVRPAVEPATANQLGASRGVALPTSQRCCEPGVPCCFTMLGTGSMMLVNCIDFLCLCRFTPFQHNHLHPPQCLLCFPLLHCRHQDAMLPTISRTCQTSTCKHGVRADTMLLAV
jgi:hypothetical protein